MTISKLVPELLLDMPTPSNFVNPKSPICQSYMKERPSTLGKFDTLRKDQIEPFFKKNKNLKRKTEIALALINELDARLKVASSDSETTTPKVDSSKRIVEAFGIFLGQVFAPADAVSTNPFNEVLGYDSRYKNYPVHEVKPEKPNRSFDKYYVMITPVSKKIYSIWGVGSAKGESDEVYNACKEEVAVITEALQSKYDFSMGSKSSDQTYHLQDNRRIMVECKSHITDTSDSMINSDGTLNHNAVLNRHYTTYMLRINYM